MLQSAKNRMSTQLVAMIVNIIRRQRKSKERAMCPCTRDRLEFRRTTIAGSNRDQTHSEQSNSSRLAVSQRKFSIAALNFQIMLQMSQDSEFPRPHRWLKLGQGLTAHVSAFFCQMSARARILQPANNVNGLLSTGRQAKRVKGSQPLSGSKR